MKRLHSGFTLVELLVVITIISILMGLLIPAVNAAREVARRNQCATQVKNLALAAVQYENTKGTLPPYIDNYGLFNSSSAMPLPDPSDPANFGGGVPRHVKVGGFGVALLPWLDAQPTYEHWTQDRYPIIADDATASLGASVTVGASGAGAGFHTLAAPNLAIFQCPSNPVTDAENGRNSYISNNGLCHIRTAAVVAEVGGGSAAALFYKVDAQTKANGTSMPAYIGAGTIPQTAAPARDAFGVGPKVTLDDCKDGQGFTALYAENVQALPWYLPGFLNGGGAAPNVVIPDTVSDLSFPAVNPTEIVTGDPMTVGEMTASQFTAGWVWHFEDDMPGSITASTPTNPGAQPETSVFRKHKINGGGDTVSEDIFTLQMTLQNSPDLARPSSAHVDGVNVGFADGATRFVAQSINYRVFQAIMTPRGKSSEVPWPEFVLTDELGE